MKKQKKQNLLTAIIIILVIALAMLVGSIVYEEVINMNKQQIQNTSGQLDNEDKENGTDGEEIPNVEEKNDEGIDTEIEEEPATEEEPTEDEEENYVGEEESNTEDSAESEDEKVIALVKKEWRQDDSVTFSIEKKNGSKYRVAVRDNSTTVLAWYEVDTETWEVSEY